MKPSILLFALFTTFYLPLHAEAGSCTQDQIHAGCHTSKSTGECRIQGLLLEGPCRAPEEAPLATYECALRIRERVWPGNGGWKRVQGPFEVVTKDYETGFTGVRMKLYRQVQLDVNVRNLVNNLQRECVNYTQHHGCEVECLRQ